MAITNVWRPMSKLWGSCSLGDSFQGSSTWFMCLILSRISRKTVFYPCSCLKVRTRLPYGRLKTHPSISNLIAFNRQPEANIKGPSSETEHSEISNNFLPRPRCKSAELEIGLLSKFTYLAPCKSKQLGFLSR